MTAASSHLWYNLGTGAYVVGSIQIAYAILSAKEPVGTIKQAFLVTHSEWQYIFAHFIAEQMIVPWPRALCLRNFLFLNYGDL